MLTDSELDYKEGEVMSSLRWAVHDFPYPISSSDGDRGSRSYRSMYMVKSMLNNQHLINGKDYMFVAQTYGKKCIQVAFANDSHALFCKMLWLGSDYYNGKSK
jgi:hypothetical protein